MSAAEDQRLTELLPWYVNGSLDAQGRAWVDQMVAVHPAAAAALARERHLSAASEAMLLPVIAQDLGLARLRSRIRADATNAVTASVRAARTSLWTRFQHGLSRPQWVSAMGVLVVAQAGLIAWLALTPDVTSEEVSATRSVGVTQVHTLRVSFRADASEREIRAALVGAAARIVGGPTQIGEYWVASDLSSLEEIRAALLKSNVITAIDVDLAGPRGR